MATLEQRVHQVVADVFGLSAETVDPTTSHDSVENWDSVNILHLVMALEAEFGISLSPDEAADLLSVEIIYAVLREKGLS